MRRRFGLPSGVSWLSLELNTLSTLFERLALCSLETVELETDTAGLAGAGGRGRGTGTSATGLINNAMNIWMDPMTCTDIMLPAWWLISVRNRVGNPNSRLVKLKLDIALTVLAPHWHAANVSFDVGMPCVCRHSRAVSQRP